MDTLKCDRCSSLGLSFHAENIYPYEYLEGKPTADIWIVGLNPKGEIGGINKRTKEDFISFDPDCHSYFHDFKKVSKKLYSNWKSQDSKVAHTDLVKCASPSFPATGKYLDQEAIVKNCKVHLLEQIKRGKPKVIICNGSVVCREMINFFPPETTEPTNTLTSYKAVYEGHSFWIVLSGFIGRIDDRNKRRLGKEIEQILDLEKIVL